MNKKDISIGIFLLVLPYLFLIYSPKIYKENTGAINFADHKTLFLIILLIPVIAAISIIVRSNKKSQAWGIFGLAALIFSIGVFFIALFLVIFNPFPLM